MKHLRILLAGGGSGGHIFPLVAVAEELGKQAESFGVPLDMRYFGAEREYAQNLADAGVYFTPILSSKFRRYWSPLNLIDALKFFLSLIQALWKIFWFMPDAVFSKGGPGALPVILASKFYLIPVIIHESDSVPGITSRISGKFAAKIYLAFSSAAEYFNNPNLEVVGNPVRNSLLDEAVTLNQENAKKEFGFNPDEPLLIVIGGSQGAEKLNDFVLENSELLLQNFQLLHQTGKNNYSGYKKEWEFLSKDWSEVEKNRYHFQAFFGKDFASALVAADLVLARSGAGTIFELAAFGKPAILAPLGQSANGHQKKNAYSYAETGAAIVIQEENLLGNLVSEQLNKLIGDPAALQKMSAAARSFYRPEATQIIAKHLLTFIK